MYLRKDKSTCKIRKHHVFLKVNNYYKITQQYGLEISFESLEFLLISKNAKLMNFLT